MAKAAITGASGPSGRYFARLLPGRRSAVWQYCLTLAVCLLLALPGLASAATVSGLYEARVKVSDTGTESRKKGFEEALKQVLVRVTGSREVLEHEDLEKLTDNLESRVAEYGYSDSDGDLRLEVTFDSSAITRGLADLNVPVWGASRPGVLAWIAVDERGGRKLVRRADGEDDEEAAESPWRAGFLEAARDRGVPVMLPRYDADERSRLGLSEIWGEFMDPIRAASESYRADRLAIVRVSARGSTLQARWRLQVRQGSGMESGQVTADSPEALMAEVLDAWATLYSSVYAVDPSQVGDAQRLDLRVSDVRSLADYAAVRRSLLRMEPVTAAEPVGVSRDQLHLQLRFSGDVRTLEEYVALDQRFTAIEDDEPAETPPMTTGWLMEGESAARPAEVVELAEDFSSLYPALYYRWTPEEDPAEALEEAEPLEDIESLEDLDLEGGGLQGF